MQRPLLRAPLVLLALGASIALARPTSADVPVPACSDTPVECGRIAFNAGVAASEKGDWATARLRFREAYALRPHPVIGFNLAVAEAKNGLFVEAVEHFDQVLKDPATPKATAKKAKAEREAAARSLAVVVLDTADANASVVLLDQKPIEGSPPRAVANPGDHQVHVESANRPPIDRTIRLLPGETLRITFDRSRELLVVPALSASSSAAPPPSSTPPRRALLSRPWFYAGVGATGVVAVLTLWSGLNTLSAFHDYEDALPSLSQEQINSRVSQGHDKELRTNLLLATTGVLAAGTAVVGLFLVGWGPQDKPAISLQTNGSSVSFQAAF